MNIVWHKHSVTKIQRSDLKKQKPCVIWLTGLSGSGKSTLANALEYKMYEQGYHTYLMDGDNVRHGLNSDLGFDKVSRTENIRRIAEVCKLFVDSGIIVITAFISPFKSDRDFARSLFETNEFIEVFIDTPIDVCKQRDPKGLYKKAELGLVKNFTGIDDVYERPINPEIILHNIYIDDSIDEILKYLEKIQKY